jgi:hypothetical protein
MYVFLNEPGGLVGELISYTNIYAGGRQLFL